MKVRRSISVAIRPHMDTTERWLGEDRGLIAAWEVGREMSRSNLEAAEAARRGELVPVPWKGGVEKPIKGGKVGVFRYLAMWQGLRGEDLEIDTDERPQVTCTRFSVPVRFTDDPSEIGASSDE